MVGILDIGMKNSYENKLTPFNLSIQEEKWILEAAKYHSYFKVELMSDNKIRKAYFMDASNAEEVSEEDKEKYNFIRRVKDEGVIQKKVNLKTFLRFWNKHLITSLDNYGSIEYVKDERFDKYYICRPIGWAMDSLQADNYGE